MNMRKFIYWDIHMQLRDMRNPERYTIAFAPLLYPGTRNNKFKKRKKELMKRKRKKNIDKVKKKETMPMETHATHEKGE